MKVRDDILAILSNCHIEGNMVFLPPGQLDRKTYVDVNKCLENIGGKWNRKVKGHIFEVDPTDDFENLLLTGETEDMKKKFQFFPTPQPVAKMMCQIAELETAKVVLEPSCGRGDLMDVIWKYKRPMIGVELNPAMTVHLQQKLYRDCIQ